MSIGVDSSRAGTGKTLEVPVLFDAGRPAIGDYTCAECGYGVAVRSMLPVCPMCRGLSWEPTASRQSGPPPF